MKHSISVACMRSVKAAPARPQPGQGCLSKPRIPAIWMRVGETHCAHLKHKVGCDGPFALTERDMNAFGYRF